MGLTLVEKIAARHADGLTSGPCARGGFPVDSAPACDDARQYRGGDAEVQADRRERDLGTASAGFRDRSRHSEHDSEESGKVCEIDAFARTRESILSAGHGHSHQVMVDRAMSFRALVVGSDSHSNLYGAVAALGTPVVRTDAASIWATGVTWWQVPKVARRC